MDDEDKEDMCKLMGGSNKSAYKTLHTLRCSSCHWSSCTDLTLDICVPRFLCTPLQSMHKNTPNVTEAQSGSVQRRVRTKADQCYANRNDKRYVR